MMLSLLFALLFAAAATAALLWPRSALRTGLEYWLQLRRRSLFEDALKHLLWHKHQGRVANAESLSGALGLPARKTLDLIVRMEAARMLVSQAGGLRLTDEGERLALQVMRAHRLWETYLNYEARMPIGKIHKAAERAEHRLSAGALDALEAQLGHPRHDPHGDPIPTGSGELALIQAVPLTDWPAGEPAQVIHLEDEPPSVFERIPSEALRPGVIVRVLDSSPEALRVSDGDKVHLIAPAVAANIQVSAVAAAPEPVEAKTRLSDLKIDEEGEIVLIDPKIRGFSRRRLLDLGLTRGALVRAHLDNSFGDPRAFRVRGTTVALRADQASGIWVERLSSGPATALLKPEGSKQ